MYPDDRRYTKEHEWVKAEGDLSRVGITDYAQNQLGDVVYLELPEVGRRLEAGEPFGTVESVKAVSELFAPVAGEVVEVNSELVSNPEGINKDPHGQGWMIVVRPKDAGAAASLLDARAYQALVEGGAK